MFNDLIEKIDFEFDKYLSYLRLVSRSDLIDRTFEITCKKLIYERLRDEYTEGKLPAELVEKLLVINDVIDYIYLKSSSKNLLNIRKNGFAGNSWNQILLSLNI